MHRIVRITRWTPYGVVLREKKYSLQTKLGGVLGRHRQCEGAFGRLDTQRRDHYGRVAVGEKPRNGRRAPYLRVAQQHMSQSTATESR